MLTLNVFYHTSSWTLNAAHFTDVAQRDAHGAHNSKVTGSTPVVGIVELDVKRSIHRCGAVEARCKTPSSTFIPPVVRFEDGYGSQPRGRRIETYHR